MLGNRYGDLIEALEYDCARACKTAEPCEECASCLAAQEFARLHRSQEQLRALVQAVRDDRAKGRQTLEQDIGTGFRIATAAYAYVDALIEAERPGGEESLCECGHSYHDHDEETAECLRTGCDCAKCDCGNPGPLELPIRHGWTCGKVPHEAEGYLHSASDDGPYDVDGVMYCGRCHEVIS